MAKLGLTATDISDAINAQNRQNPAGALGQPPAPNGTDFQYAVNAPGRLINPEQFGDIVLRAAAGRFPAAHSRYRPRGTGRVHLQRLQPPERQAILQCDRVSFARRERRRNIQRDPGVHEASQEELSRRHRLHDPVRFHAFCARRHSGRGHHAARGRRTGDLVVFIFLQNWRATLIPLLTVPVAVIGASRCFPLLGFSINITSMFGLVLAIGIVVDDAIVVVEAVQRNIDDGMMPREATMRAMDEVSAPVVAIACILAAVFIPVAFLGGISGQIYGSSR